MDQPSDTVASRLDRIQLRVTQLSFQLPYAQSPRELFEDQKRLISTRIDESRAKFGSHDGDADVRSALFDQILSYGGELKELELTYEAHGKEKEESYQQCLEAQLTAVSTDLLRILGRPLVLKSLSQLSWTEPAAVASTHAASTPPRLEPVPISTPAPPSEEPRLGTASTPSAAIDKTPREEHAVATNNGHARAGSGSSAAATPNGHAASSHHKAEPQAQEKRKAADHLEKPGSPKTPRTDKAQPLTEDESVRLAQGDKSIDFNDVYQDGKAERNYFILEHPTSSGEYYILRCLKHNFFSRRKPTLAGAKHIHSKRHSVPGMGKQVTFKEIGVRVWNCTPALVAMNNAAAAREFGLEEISGDSKAKAQQTNTAEGDESPQMPATPSAPRSNSSSDAKPAASQVENPTSTRKGRRNTRQNAPGILNPTVGELYLAHWGPGQFYAVLVLPVTPMESLERFGLRGTLKDTGLLSKVKIPSCYAFDPKTLRIEGWKNGYEDGGRDVAKRRFPCKYFDGDPFESSSVGWVHAKDFKEIDLSDKNLHYRDTILRFLDDRKLSLAQRKEPTNVPDNLDGSADFRSPNAGDESSTPKKENGKVSPADANQTTATGLGIDLNSEKSPWAFGEFYQDGVNKSGDSPAEASRVHTESAQLATEAMDDITRPVASPEHLNDDAGPSSTTENMRQESATEAPIPPAAALPGQRKSPRVARAETVPYGSSDGGDYDNVSPVEHKSNIPRTEGSRQGSTRQPSLEPSAALKGNGEGAEKQPAGPPRPTQPAHQYAQAKMESPTLPTPASLSEPTLPESPMAQHLRMAAAAATTKSFNLACAMANKQVNVPSRSTSTVSPMVPNASDPIRAATVPQSSPQTSHNSPRQDGAAFQVEEVRRASTGGHPRAEHRYFDDVLGPPAPSPYEPVRQPPPSEYANYGAGNPTPFPMMEQRSSQQAHLFHLNHVNGALPNQNSPTASASGQERRMYGY